VVARSLAENAFWGAVTNSHHFVGFLALVVVVACVVVTSTAVALGGRPSALRRCVVMPVTVGWP
jgi:hypothetical protein